MPQKKQVKNFDFFCHFFLRCAAISLFCLNNILAQETLNLDAFNAFNAPKAQKDLFDFVDKNTIVFITINDVITIPKAKMFAPGNFYRNFLFYLNSASQNKPHYQAAGDANRIS